MTIRAILFDKDGTLLDFWPSWGPIAVAAAAHAAGGDEELAAHLLRVAGLGLDGHEADPGSVFAAGSAAEIAALWVAAGAPFTAERLTVELDALFRASVGSVVPVGDLRAILGRLAALGHRLGIASSDGEAAIRATVTRFGLDDLVEFVAGWDSGLGGKPGPGMVLGFSRAIGIAPAEIAVVGDTLHDLEMAEAAGAGLRVGVLTGTGTRERLAARADLVLGSIAELADRLAGPSTE
jgi:phosphoglycolate phosphatase